MRPKPRDPALWTAMVCTLGAAFGPSALFAGTFAFFVGPVGQSFHWSQTAVFAIFSVSVVISPFMLPLAGRWIDRWGSRRVVIPSTAVYGLALMSLALSTGSKPLMALTFLVIGIAGFISGVVGYAKLIAMWFDGNRGWMLAITMGGGGAIGSALGVPIFERVIESAGWRAGYLAIGAAVLVLVVPFQWLFLHEPATTAGTPGSLPETEARRHAPATAEIPALRRPAFWLLALSSALCASAIMIVRQHAVPMFAQQGYSADQAALAMSAFGVFMFAGQLTAGVLLDRCAWPGRLCAALALLPLAGVALLWHGAHALSVLLLAAGLIGFANGGEYAALPYIVSRYFGLRHFARVQGATMLIVTLSLGLSPVGASVLHAASGTYDTVVLLLEVAFVASAALFAMLPPLPAVAADRNGTGPTRVTAEGRAGHLPASLYRRISSRHRRFDPELNSACEGDPPK